MAAVALAVALVMTFSNLGLVVERELRTMRTGWRTHPASGKIAILEVDARSLAALDHWPWPHHYWARVLDQLGIAGARLIGFDIDLSSVSTASDDRALADALRRRGGAVILPTFTQYAESGSRQTLDTLPRGIFRDSAFLAGVNVTPDADGVVRAYPLQIATRGVTRPSIGAMLAETTNLTRATTFPVDYAIDPDTIPRISLIDLYRGRVPASAIAGKRILVGATAIELGDRYPAPGYGVIPGVVIQALAAETLIQDGVRQSWGPLPLLAVALVGIGAVVALVRGRRQLALLAALAFGLFLAPWPFEVLGCELDTVPAVATILAALATASGAMLLQELWSRRFVDQESGLANSRALEADAAPLPQVDMAVVRVERLNEIAAGLGHATSDVVLIKLAERLGRLVQETVYRVEEDALAWMAPAQLDEEQASERFQSIANALKATIDVGRGGIEVRATLGVAQGSGRDARDLIAGAQIAARRARSRGGDWDRFVAGDGDAARWNMALLGSLSEAIARGEMWVAYQPKVAAVDGRIVGAEALVRWRHPTRGMIPPDSFIPLIENEGRASELTAFVLATAANDLARWREEGHDIAVAVNISATLLRDPAVVAMVADTLATTAIDPAKLTLELTESAIIADAEIATETIDRLRSLGVKLSIDDYGTGQSTLTYLKRFPANELKIDKSFIQNIVRSTSDRLLVRSTVELAHAMGMTVVAEGVEDAECLNALQSLGCDTIQGWHTGKPMPAAQFEDGLRQVERLAA